MYVRGESDTTAFSPPRGHPSLLQARPTQALTRIPRCYTYRSRPLPPQSPQHRHLHHHVKTKFLNLSVKGCSPPKASNPDAARSATLPLSNRRSTQFTGLALLAKPSRENPPARETSPRGKQGGQGPPLPVPPHRCEAQGGGVCVCGAGGEAPTGSSPLLPPGSADRTLASSSPPHPAFSLPPTPVPDVSAEPGTGEGDEGRERQAEGPVRPSGGATRPRGGAAPEGGDGAPWRARPPLTGAGAGQPLKIYSRLPQTGIRIQPRSNGAP